MDTYLGKELDVVKKSHKDVEMVFAIPTGFFLLMAHLPSTAGQF